MKFKTKKWFKIICVAVAGILVGGAIASIGNVFDRELNEDNFIQVDDYVIEDEKTDIGLTIDVDEDTGVIKFSGKAEEDHTFIVSQVELKAGTYTISGYDDSSKGRCYLSVLYDIDQVAMSGAKTKTFTLAEDQTVTVQIVVSEDASFNFLTARTFMPCIVEGESEGNIFAK